jgi:hypothetical protein
MMVLLGVVATPAREAQSVGIDSTLTNLLSGLIGAVIGALLTAKFADRTAHDIQRKERLHEQQSSARVITIELVHNQTMLEAFKKSGTWQADLLNRNFWEGEAANAAQALKPGELITVGRPYLYMQSLEAVAAAYRKNNNPQGMWSAQAERDIRDFAIDGCGKAIDVLRTLAGFSDAEFDELQKAASK